MKKYVLAMLMIVVMMIMAACSEEAEPTTDIKEPETKVAETTDVKESETKEEESIVVEEPKEEEEDSTEVSASNTPLNYDNTENGVKSEVMDILGDVSVILASGDKHSFTLDEIKSWFSDFDGSNKQLDVYLVKIAEQNLNALEVMNSHNVFKEMKMDEKNVWDIELEKTGTKDGKTVVTNWSIIAQPGPKGDLVIDINEIK